LYRITRDRNASEELAQEVFLRIHRNRKDYEPTARFTTWLHTIACRLALNWLRDNKHRALLSPIDPEQGTARAWEFTDPHFRVDEWMVQESRRAQVRRAIHALPERQRTVLLLHKFEEIECERIALQMGCSHQAVRSLLVRAYSALRTQLAC
jgi:RNA polymerase sigma-70 factor (ECF subfamily)